MSNITWMIRGNTWQREPDLLNIPLSRLIRWRGLYSFGFALVMSLYLPLAAVKQRLFCVIVLTRFCFGDLNELLVIFMSF